MVANGCHRALKREWGKVDEEIQRERRKAHEEITWMRGSCTTALFSSRHMQLQHCSDPLPLRRLRHHFRLFFALFAV